MILQWCNVSFINRIHLDRIHLDRLHLDRLHLDRLHLDRLHLDRLHLDRLHSCLLALSMEQLMTTCRQPVSHQVPGVVRYCIRSDGYEI